MIPRILASLLFGLAALATAQSDIFDKAPPQVEQALRERVSKFYQAHIDAKFRQADLVVAEESKDEFFGMAKPVYKKFEFVKATYSDNYTKATVVTAVDREMNIRGNVYPVHAPVTTTWKVINGQWFWYLDPEGLKHSETPMGKMNAGPTDNNRPAGMPADFSRMINDPARRAELAESIRNKVSVNKTELTLPLEKASSETIEITNGLEGPMQAELEIVGGFPGFTVKLDKTEVAAGGKISVQVNFAPGAELPSKPSATVMIHIVQTTQVFNIPIRFTKAE